MDNKQLTLEQEKLDLNLNIIGIIALIAFGLYAVYGNQMKEVVTSNTVHVVLRLLAAAIQFSIAGLGTVIVVMLRRENFYEFGLQKETDFINSSVYVSLFSSIYYLYFCFREFSRVPYFDYFYNR